MCVYIYTLELVLNIKKIYEAVTPVSPDYHNQTVDAAINYINNHCIQNSVLLDDIAKKLNISKFHLSRLFKQYVGTSVKPVILSVWKTTLIFIKIIKTFWAFLQAKHIIYLKILNNFLFPSFLHIKFKCFLWIIRLLKYSFINVIIKCQILRKYSYK